jgi:glutathione S-transferase
VAHNARQRGLVYQWSVWSQTEIDRRDWYKVRRLGNAELINTARSEELAALTLLDTALAKQPYLLGADFTLADLNVASTLSEPHEGGLIGLDRLSPSKLGLVALAAWLSRCTGRSSWAHVRTLS